MVGEGISWALGRWLGGLGAVGVLAVAEVLAVFC